MRLTMLLPIAALAMASCASVDTPSQTVTRVVSTTSFGMCVGYCTTRLEITEGQAVLIREARGGRGAPQPTPPEQRFTRPLSAAEWQEIQQLAAAADMRALPDVVGCPDCADGGAEGLTIEGTVGAESVSFEFRADLEPVQPLLNRVRVLREEMTPATAQ